MNRAAAHKALSGLGLCIWAALAGAPSALADPLPSSALPQDFLEACEERAMPFGAYDRTIADAVDALTAMGVFMEEEFYGVNIGFCGMRKINGPAGTAACAHDTILLDSGYDTNHRSLVLKATLAHEMKHVLQHRAARTRSGDAYCTSNQYNDDKGWMEAEADAFGDGVAALFFTGRPVEVENDCPVAISLYLEADAPLSRPESAPQFMTVPARSTLTAPMRALTTSFLLYGESEPHKGVTKQWSHARTPHKRRIDGEIYKMTSVSLQASDRSRGPFRLTLVCTDDA